MRAIFVMGWFLLVAALVRGQSIPAASLVSAGGSGMAGGCMVSYTIGQTFVQQSVAGQKSISSGLLQPVEVSRNMSSLSGDIKISVYPNPAGEQIQLAFSSETTYDVLTIRILSTSGSVLVSKQIHVAGAYTFPLQLHNLPSGSYVLELLDPQAKAYGVCSFIKK